MISVPYREGRMIYLISGFSVAGFSSIKAPTLDGELVELLMPEEQLKELRARIDAWVKSLSWKELFDKVIIRSKTLPIGTKVWKNPKTTSKFQPKPFKSRRKINTVLAIVTHPETGWPGYKFEEDSSIVECWRCSEAPISLYEEQACMLTGEV